MDPGTEYFWFHLYSSGRTFCRLSVPSKCQAANSHAVLRWTAGTMSELDDHFVITDKAISSYFNGIISPHVWCCQPHFILLGVFVRHRLYLGWINRWAALHSRTVQIILPVPDYLCLSPRYGLWSSVLLRIWFQDSGSGLLHFQTLQVWWWV